MDFREEDMRGRRLAHYMWAELEKIAQGVGGEMTTMSDQQSGELQGTVQREVEGIEEASPAHGVVASRVEQIGDDKARGIPVIQAPPGYVYAPDLQAFVPDPKNPAWMAAEQAAEAAKAETFYRKGQQDLVTRQAQAEAARQAQQQVVAQQQAIAQERAAVMAAEQQQARAQAMAQKEGLREMAREQAAEQAQDQAKELRSPQDITGRPSPQKGVTIRIGR